MTQNSFNDESDAALAGTCPSCGRVSSENKIDIRTQENMGSRMCDAFECGACGLLWLSDYRDDRSHVYGPGYAAWGKGVGDDDAIAASKRRSFADQLRALTQLTDQRGRLLDVGTGVGYLMDEAEKMGFEAYGVDLSDYAVRQADERHPGRVKVGTLSEAGYPAESFDVITMTDLIEHVADPLQLLSEAYELLKPSGLLFIITPDAGSLSRRLLGPNWMQYKYEHVIYWNPRSLSRALEQTGFEPIKIRHNWKTFSPAYYAAYFRKYSLLGGLGQVLVKLHDLLPKRLQRLPFPNPITGEMLAIARKK